jgi:ParB family chromosome partitioning protein
MSDPITENQNKRKGLGRGLGSLLSGVPSNESMPSISDSKMPEALSSAKSIETAQESGSSQDRVWTISIEKLRGGIYQPRKNFDRESLEELSKSIKEHGILQPIVVRPVGSGQMGHFEIVAGERRWRAAQSAGLHEVPVLIRNYSNQKTLELSLIENLQRADLNPIEEAEGYFRLQAEFKLTQEQIADRVGKERATVANALRLLKLTPEVRALVQAGQLSAGHAKVLLGLSDLGQQKKWALQSVEQHLSVRKLEQIVSLNNSSSAQKNQSSSVDEKSQNVTQRLISGLSDELQKLLGTKVMIDYHNSKGKLSIYYYSDDELTSIVEKLRSGVKN